MKFFSLERSIWIAIVAGITLATISATNYVRDHEVFRKTAEQCAGDKSALQQEIERHQAEVEKQKLTIDQLKSLPVR